eukprot:CAMPEP_0206533882 /NCGR_PEP_ID=MMETSP0325_2-20121206/5225_1 /ASSEMBLY_ACC=CAM_ASM_000347 /TAXON_ID=2866 /ORGANISM="Crypthecodinium cohnii, Strain Seligo" /LENGTH=807 /DNA_ID=CAMNT_0054030601 /DNA_START=42 /DNA_END=2461 /DNA_ORIENTATION=-
MANISGPKEEQPASFSEADKEEAQTSTEAPGRTAPGYLPTCENEAQQPDRDNPSASSSGNGCGAMASHPKGISGNMRNIAVSIRVRPLSSAEAASTNAHANGGVNSKIAWRADQNTSSLWDLQAQEKWLFDRVFGPSSTTQQLFETFVEDAVRAFVNGFNATVFAYGQTGSGKTYTMYGDGHREGLVPRSVLALFQILGEDKKRSFHMSASYLEIYNEQVSDLLSLSEAEVKCQNDEFGNLQMKTLTCREVKSPADIFQCLAEGSSRRHIAETRMNERSSRSHTIFRLCLDAEVSMQQGMRQHSQLNLVDLAGSEGLKNTAATGLRRREGSSINRSLHALSKVIQALSDEKSHAASRHVAYRESKLTRILKPALGGNSHTLVICTMSPAMSNYTESRSTLDFASRAKKVQNKVKLNMSDEGKDKVHALQKDLDRLKGQLADLTDCEQLELKELILSLEERVQKEMEAAQQSRSRLSVAAVPRNLATVPCAEENERTLIKRFGYVPGRSRRMSAVSSRFSLSSPAPRKIASEVGGGLDSSLGDIQQEDEEAEMSSNECDAEEQQCHLPHKTIAANVEALEVISDDDMDLCDSPRPVRTVSPFCSSTSAAASAPGSEVIFAPSGSQASSTTAARGAKSSLCSDESPTSSQSSSSSNPRPSSNSFQDPQSELSLLSAECSCEGGDNGSGECAKPSQSQPLQPEICGADADPADIQTGAHGSCEDQLGMDDSISGHLPDRQYSEVGVCSFQETQQDVKAPAGSCEKEEELRLCRDLPESVAVDGQQIDHECSSSSCVQGKEDTVDVEKDVT